MTSMTSPRPEPKFFQETQQLSTKKERGCSRYKEPPRPPAKFMPPVSRIFRETTNYKAQTVSFRKSETSIVSKHYDEQRVDLYFDQCFEVVCKLGVGSFGEVFKVRSKEDGKYYAVKRSRERFRGDSDRKRKLEEVRKHEQLPHHRNCIKFYQAWEEKQHLYIQTELCDTSLSNYAEQCHEIAETVIWNYLVDLLLAVKHLHDHNVIHLDLKPENIFISHDDVCKLGDFGLVVDMSKGNLSEAQEGDPKYLAPELMEGKFTKAADIFSLGITILELACDLNLPHGGDSWHQLRRSEIPLEFTSHLSSDLTNVIQLLMWPDFRSRPSVNDILAHPAVKKVYQRRRRQLFFKAFVATFRDIWVAFLQICHIVYIIISWPRRFLRKDHCAAKNVRHPTDWDLSSDEDLANLDDSLNRSQGSAFIHSDNSTSAESRSDSFETMLRERQAYTTSSRVKPNKNDGNNITPPQSQLRSWGSFEKSPVSSSPNLSLRDSSSWKQLGAKNLLEMFDSMSDDD